jgi:hypothetical protein
MRVGGAVEAGANGGHLVAPSSATRWSSLPAPKASTPCLQRLQPARQTTHHRPGAGRHGDKQHHQQKPPGWRHPSSAVAPSHGGGGGGTPRTGPAPRARPGRHPQRAAIVERHRLHPGAHVAGRPPAARWKDSEVTMRRPSASSSAIGRRSLADHSRTACACAGSGASASRQRALQQLAPGQGALAQHALVARALLLEMALHQPARDQREQRQRGTTTVR